VSPTEIWLTIMTALVTVGLLAVAAGELYLERRRATMPCCAHRCTSDRRAARQARDGAR
jgi:hypothetical protein